MSNFTPQQIEEFLQEFFDVVGARQYIGARYVPIFGRKGESTIEWDGGAGAYEPLTIVTWQGNSYTSRTYVPTGIDITNSDYWALTSAYNAQVEAYRAEVQQLQLSFVDFEEDVNERIDAAIDEFEDRYSPNIIPNAATIRQLHDSPLKIAHRGNMYQYGFENTIVAYDWAANNGADMVEIDIWFTSDNVPVIMHDATLSSYVEGSTLRVNTSTYAEISQLRINVPTFLYGSPETQVPEYFRVFPTFDDVCKFASYRGIGVCVEIKPSTLTDEQVNILYATTTKYGIENKMFYMGANEPILKMKELYPTIRGFILHNTVSDTDVDVAVANGLGLSTTNLDAPAIATANTAGVPILVWTVPAPFDLSAYPNVIGFITNNVAQAGPNPNDLEFRVNDAMFRRGHLVSLSANGHGFSKHRTPYVSATNVGGFLGFQPTTNENYYGRFQPVAIEAKEYMNRFYMLEMLDPSVNAASPTIREAVYTSYDGNPPTQTNSGRFNGCYTGDGQTTLMAHVNGINSSSEGINEYVTVYAVPYLPNTANDVIVNACDARFRVRPTQWGKNYGAERTNVEGVPTRFTVNDRAIKYLKAITTDNTKVTIAIPPLNIGPNCYIYIRFNVCNKTTIRNITNVTYNNYVIVSKDTNVTSSSTRVLLYSNVPNTITFDVANLNMTSDQIAMLWVWANYFEDDTLVEMPSADTQTTAVTDLVYEACSALVGFVKYAKVEIV